MTVTDAKSRVAYYAAAYGVPVDLALAVAQRESGFNQDARGRSGEIGIMQLMPPTAAHLKVNSYDPEANIEGGVRLLRDEYKRFGSWSYALAAYNCGAACAAKGPDHWPDATRKYVAETVGMPSSTGTTGEWSDDADAPTPTEFDLLGGADSIMLLAIAAVVVVLYFYLTD
jgi:soluble lytic murein transglycosylase-like protein